MNLEQIKKHGAILGLEAEMNVRLGKIKDSQLNKQWANVRSHAIFVSELAEELRKLCDSTAQNKSSTPSSNV